MVCLARFLFPFASAALQLSRPELLLRRILWQLRDLGNRKVHDFIIWTRPQGGGSRKGNEKVVKADAGARRYLPLRSNDPSDARIKSMCDDFLVVAVWLAGMAE